MNTLLIITKNYPPAICGVGDHTARLVRELENRGISTRVFTETREAAGNNIWVAEKPFGKGIEKQLRQLIAENGITHILWQYVPYSYQQKGLPFWWPVLMRKIARPGLHQSIFFHEVSLRVWGYGFRQMIAAIGQRYIAQLAAIRAKTIFTSIPLYAGYFRFKKPLLVPISSNLVLSATDMPGNPLTGDYIFCFANRADKALVRAIKMLRQKQDIILVLGGSVSDEKRAAIRQWLAEFGVGEHVRVTGPLENGVLAQMINQAVIYIQPQVVERKNQGGVSAKNGTVMAAMAMGKAIITCRGDMTDPLLFREGENMVFVPYGDAEAYVSAIQNLLDDPALRQSIGTAAKATYDQQCSWNKTAPAILSALGLMNHDLVRKGFR